MAINWTKTKIVNSLRERGTSAAEVAKAAGLSRHTLYSSMERPYPRAHTLIARALKMNRHDIWPAFYGADDCRLSRREQIKSSLSAARSAA